MKGKRQVNKIIIIIETIEPWIVCHSEGERARQNIEVPLNGVR
jgi:hypothetical protein